MKLKCIPEDFIVTEVTGRVPSTGSYSLYRLSKQSIGTLEALQILQRAWNLTPRQISHGGLKDRHAATTQFLTIRHGSRAAFEHDLFQLEYLGPTPTAYAASDITGNRFEIVLRSLSADDCRGIERHAAAVADTGFPNYFDQQRFGSIGPSAQFVAALWCLKDYERALWLALAEHNRHDDAAERQQKQILRDLWGRWSECKQQLDRSHRRSIVTYLVDHPLNFRKAFALLNGNLRGLFLSAFQSAVWNRMLADALREAAADSSSVPEYRYLAIGDSDLPVPEHMPDAVRLPPSLPLPSARCKDLSADLQRLCRQALESYGMTLPQMKLSFPRDRWFSRGLRFTGVVPHDFHIGAADDDRYRHRRKMMLSCELPRGSYATMLVKTLTADVAAAHSDVSAAAENGE